MTPRSGRVTVGPFWHEARAASERRTIDDSIVGGPEKLQIMPSANERAGLPLGSGMRPGLPVRGGLLMTALWVGLKGCNSYMVLQNG